jgi:hypothetical protein
MLKLTFRRIMGQARPFELAALNTVPDLGGYYPVDSLSAGHLEAELTSPNRPAVESNLTVFFRLIDLDGRENIEIVEQVLPGVFHYAGWIPPGGDGRANATITDKVVNGHFVLTSTIDGNTVEFIYDTGFYVTTDAQVSRTVKLKAAAAA